MDSEQLPCTQWSFEHGTEQCALLKVSCASFHLGTVSQPASTAIFLIQGTPLCGVFVLLFVPGKHHLVVLSRSEFLLLLLVFLYLPEASYLCISGRERIFV